MSECIIEKIDLGLDGKTISLTPEQAKRLKFALDNLFDKTVVFTVKEEYVLPTQCINRWVEDSHTVPTKDVVTIGITLKGWLGFKA